MNIVLREVFAIRKHHETVIDKNNIDDLIEYIKNELNENNITIDDIQKDPAKYSDQILEYAIRKELYDEEGFEEDRFLEDIELDIEK